jgi:hypothetical protein
MQIIDISDVDSNLRDDIGDDTTGFTAYEADMPGATVSNQALHIVHSADGYRGGIVQVGSGSSGVTFWTDAGTPEEVLRRYLDDDMTP